MEGHQAVMLAHSQQPALCYAAAVAAVQNTLSDRREDLEQVALALGRAAVVGHHRNCSLNCRRYTPLSLLGGDVSPPAQLATPSLEFLSNLVNIDSCKSEGTQTSDLLCFCRQLLDVLSRNHPQDNHIVISFLVPQVCLF